jgi:hypothetical protein
MSQISNPGVIASIAAAAALVAKRFVGVDGNYCAAGAQPIGVSINPVDSGEQVGVMVSGIAILESGAAVTAGSYVQSDSTGRAINMVAMTDTAGRNKTACGVALEAATAAGQYIRVRIS